MVLVLVEVRVRPGHVEEFLQMCRKGFPHTRSFDGCRELNAYLQEDGETVVAVEVWETQQHYEKYLHWRAESGAMDAMEALLQAPPTIRFFEPVDA